MKPFALKKAYWPLALLMGLCFGFSCYHYIAINISPSMPRGLYIKEDVGQLRPGDAVLFCLPKNLSAFGLHRGYLFFGGCQGHVAPLIKEIIAVPGDDVALSNLGLTVNGVFFAMPLLVKDEGGRAMPSIQRGIYSHTKGYWLLGKTDVNSWDSRYWGPINASLMKAKVTHIRI